MSLVLRNKSRFDKRVPILEQTSLVENRLSSDSNRDDLKLGGFPETVSDPNFFGFHCQKYKQVLSCCHTHIYIYIFYSVLLTLLTVQCKARIQPKGPYSI